MGILRGHRGLGCRAWPSPMTARPLASAGEDGTVRLWNLRTDPVGETDQPARILQGHSGPVFGVAFSPDGASLASAGQDGTVRLWSLRGGPGPTVGFSEGTSQPVRCVAFHPSGKLLASAGADRTGPSLGHRHRGGDCCDSATLATASTGSPSARTAAGSRPLASIARCGSGMPMTGKPLGSFPGHAAPAFSVTFSPDGKQLASASQDCNGQGVGPDAPSPAFASLPLEPDQQDRQPRADRLGWRSGVSTRRDRAGRRGNRPDAGRLERGDARRPTSVAATGWGPADGGALQPGRTLACLRGCRSEECRIRDAASLSETDGSRRRLRTDWSAWPSTLRERSWRREAATRSRASDNRWARSQPRDDQARPVRLWDVEDRLSAAVDRRPHRVDPCAACSTHDGTRLISAGADRVIRIWDTGDGRLLRTLEGHSKPIHALALGPDGRHLASAGADGIDQDLGASRRPPDPID